MGSLYFQGDETYWTMKAINDAAPERFAGTNQRNVYPFILKLDSNDNLVWSTYFFTTQPIISMAIDSKDNLYIGGNSIEGSLPVTEKEGSSFYNGKSLYKDGNINLPIEEMERRAYLAEFNKANQLLWCTYLEDSVDNKKNTITVINDIDIGIYDNLLLTGYTTNRKFPLQKKVNAYYQEFPTTTYPYYGPAQNTFIMEFDSSSNLLWSTIYVLDSIVFYSENNISSEGMDIEILLDGSFYIVCGTFDYSYSEHKFINFIKFSKYYILEENNLLYISVLEIDNIQRDLIVEDNLSLEKYDKYEDLKRLYNFVLPSINLEVSLLGKLYLSMNVYEYLRSPILSTYEDNQYFKIDVSSFICNSTILDGDWCQYEWFDFDYKEALEALGTSSILQMSSLCDSVGVFSFPFKDSLLCIGNEINIPLVVDDTITFSQHNLLWYKNGEEVANSTEYIIVDEGVYNFVAKNVYSDCPSFYSDTASVMYIYDTIDLDFTDDTIALCVGINDHILSAQSLDADYLWSDSTTDSTYIIRYKGDSIMIIWCEVKNDCGGWDRDSVVVRFYPPYAYLGEDIVLCNGDSLNFDASILNRSIPAVLEYKWILNGDTVFGYGDNNQFYTITEEKDSGGMLILQAIWLGSGCTVGVDTLNFSYYKYDYVEFYIPSDTTICFYEDLEIDLIANKIDNIDTNTIYLCLKSTGDTISTESSFVLKDTISYYILASNHCSKQEHTLKLSHFSDFNIRMLLPTDTAICKELFPTEIYGLTTEQIDGICYWLSENKEDTIEISPSRYINQDGTYPIILSDIYNCSQNYEITVSLKEDCSPQIDMPNVFTPNSDGVNDFFKIISADNVKDFDIVIFDKAGTKVYDYKGLIENFAWNGCYKNSARDVPEGAYFFVILYKDVTNATRKQAGALTLLR